MENNNIEESKDSERPAIPVVNGEAKPSTGKKMKVFLSLACVLLLAGLGTTSYLLNQEKADNKTLNSQIAEADAQISSLQETLDEANAAALKQGQEPALPEGYKEHVDAKNKFSLYYPESWKDFEPKVSPIKDYKMEQVYSPTLKYDAEQEGWVVADNPYKSEEYTKGSFYEASVARKDRKLTVYDFGFGEGGCGTNRLVFLVGDKVVDISSPQVCHDGEGDGNGPFDKLDAQTEEVAFSINVL